MIAGLKSVTLDVRSAGLQSRDRIIATPCLPAIDVESLRRELEAQLEGEVRFDAVSRALYSTDASVYQIQPLGVVVAEVARGCRAHRAASAGGIAARSRCAAAARRRPARRSAPASIVDTSKYFNRLLEVNADERWARVEPGIVLDELNAALQPHGLRFAPDISTRQPRHRRRHDGQQLGRRALGALRQDDRSRARAARRAVGRLARVVPAARPERARRGVRPATSLEAACYREVRRTGARVRRRDRAPLSEGAPPRRRLQPRRVRPRRSAVQPGEADRRLRGHARRSSLEAKIALVPLPTAKAVLAIQFDDLLEALEATPAILAHEPSAVEVMDAFILDHTQTERRRSIGCGRRSSTATRRRCSASSSTRDRGRGSAAAARRARARSRGAPVRLSLPSRASTPRRRRAIWRVREAALGLSMAMKGDAKSLSFVEDTAVAPEQLRDYIERFLALVARARHDAPASTRTRRSAACTCGRSST